MPSKVFLITEVLEIILLTTDMRTLLLSQRVCRRWRNLIQGSHYLRAALFWSLSDIGFHAENREFVTRS